MSEENKNIENNQEENQNRQECNKIWWKNVGLKPAYSLIVFFVLVFLAIYYIYENNIFKFRHNVFIKGPKMHFYHNGPAVLMNDGNVLVIGGDTKQAEIYDYKKNKFVLTKGKMNYVRKYGATTTKLDDGRILIIGGVTKKNRFDSPFLYEMPKYSEIYNPSIGLFTINKNTHIQRACHTAIKMSNGNILILGGITNKNVPNRKTIGEIEEFNSKTNKFNVINKFDCDKFFSCEFIKIPNDKIAIIGIWKENNTNKFKYKIFIYDYLKNIIEEFYTKSLNNINYQNIKTDLYVSNIQLDEHSQNTVQKNFVLLVKKYRDDIVNIQVKQKDSYKYDYTLSVLNNDNILLTGGNIYNGWGGKIIKDTEMFKLKSESFSPNTAKLTTKRKLHKAITLSDGNILIYGGKSKISTDSKLLFTEIYFK